MTPDDISALPYRPCVGVMLINPSGLIFAGQRIDTELPAWQMPQGGIDDGEDPLDAAMRELWEETGVTADLVSVMSQTDDWFTYDLPHNIVPRIWKGQFKGQKQLWFLLQFLGEDADIQIETNHPEFSEWRWIDADEMLESIVPFKRDLYRQVIDAFREHLCSAR